VETFIFKAISPLSFSDKVYVEEEAVI